HILTKEALTNSELASAKNFENRVRTLVSEGLKAHGVSIAEFQDQDFPDIVVGDWGIEVKHTKEDKWRTVANSVFEGHRRAEVGQVYLVYAKMGGTPKVRWARYEDSIVHVRTSHRPRYEVDMEARVSLFHNVGVSYSEFRALDEREKMRIIRSYARGRLKEGEQLWWFGDDPAEPPSLPIAVRLYTHLEPNLKLRLRAEATLLCPEVVRSGRSRRKYE